MLLRQTFYKNVLLIKTLLFLQNVALATSCHVLEHNICCLCPQLGIEGQYYVERTNIV
jgi:hypothetical protein